MLWTTPTQKALTMRIAQAESVVRALKAVEHINSQANTEHANDSTEIICLPWLAIADACIPAQHSLLSWCKQSWALGRIALCAYKRFGPHQLETEGHQVARDPHSLAKQIWHLFDLNFKTIQIYITNWPGSWAKNSLCCRIWRPSGRLCHTDGLAFR